MTEAFLETAELYVIAPLPLWSTFHEVVGDVTQPESEPTLEQSDVADVVAAGDALMRFGFAVKSDPTVIDPPPAASQLAVHFIRGIDRLALVVVRNTVFIAFQTAGPGGSLDGEMQRTGTFGAFPAHPGSDGSVGAAMRRAVGWFIEIAGDALAQQPLSVGHLCAHCDAFAEAQQRFVLARFHRRRGNSAWAEGRHRAVVDHLQQLERLATLTSQERQRLKTISPNLVDDDTVRQVRPEPMQVVVAHVNRTHLAVHDAFTRRGEAGGVARWHDSANGFNDALARFHALIGPLAKNLRDREPTAVDAAIEFLEADPWCFRSGYLKGRLMTVLRQCQLSPEQHARLVGVVLHAVDTGGRMEFRDATRLGRTLGGAALRAGLRHRLHSPDAHVARRALLALVDLRRPRLTPEDLVVARRLILDEIRRNFTDPGEYGWPAWPDRLASALAHSDWIASLLDEVRANGPDRREALVVLSRQPSLPASADDLEMLRRILLDVIRHGGNDRGMESMTCLVDSPSLRKELDRLLEDSNEKVRRRARWARNAIRRAHERG